MVEKTGRKLPSQCCASDYVENGQTMRIVLKYIHDHPADAKEPTVVLIMGSAYPSASRPRCEAALSSAPVRLAPMRRLTFQINSPKTSDRSGVQCSK